MFPFDPPENIRKPNISFPLNTHTYVCVLGGKGDPNIFVTLQDPKKFMTDLLT